MGVNLPEKAQEIIDEMSRQIRRTQVGVLNISRRTSLAEEIEQRAWKIWADAREHHQDLDSEKQCKTIVKALMRVAGPLERKLEDAVVQLHDAQHELKVERKRAREVKKELKTVTYRHERLDKEVKRLRKEAGRLKRREANWQKRDFAHRYPVKETKKPAEIKTNE